MRSKDLPVERRREIAQAVLDLGDTGAAARQMQVTKTIAAVCAREFGWPDKLAEGLAAGPGAVVVPSLDGLLARAEALPEQMRPDELVAELVGAASRLASSVEVAESVVVRRAEHARAVEAKRAEVEQMRARAERAEAELAALEGAVP